DGSLIKAKKLKLSRQTIPQHPPEIIDIGMVGDVEAIDTQLVKSLEAERFIPVIAPVGVGKEGETYNINADTVAGAMAAALQAEKLILMTDVEGVKNKQGQLISTLNDREVKRLSATGIIKGGMLPKVNCCLNALKEGVGKAHIIDGRLEHALLLEVFTSAGIGTEIVLG
ncbi:MAG TPA: acetylglutamate kinase, partial [Thermodesulfobacteriota bacterium]|nr:acetylglutamate kinase [Thermodesulfobacteriota bacterium]